MEPWARQAILDAAVATSRGSVAHALCSALDLPTTALARLWLADRAGVLRLTASTGRPLGGGSYRHLNGGFAVAGPGSKVARIAATREALVVRGLRGDEPWLENPAWVARQGIRSFAGLPLVASDEVVGVMVLFDRQLTPDTAIEDLRVAIDVVAVCCRQLPESATPSREADRPASPAAILTRLQLRDLEKRSIAAALDRTRGKIFGADGAAALLGMKPTTLASRLKALGIR